MSKVKARVVLKLSHTIITEDYDYILDLSVDDIIEVDDIETMWIYTETIHEVERSIGIESQYLVLYYGDRLPTSGLKIVIPEVRKKRENHIKQIDSKVQATIYELLSERHKN